MPIDYGSFAQATSLNLITRKLFFELAKKMNDTKSFTISASLLQDSGLGDINQHYDCTIIPNMGGYKFPLDSSLHNNNLIIGIVGIDEVVLGREVYKSEDDWKRNEPIIKNELKKWKENESKVSHIHVSNQPEKDQLIEYLKIPEQKISIVPYGVDHDLFKPIDDGIKQSTRKQILEKYKLDDSPYLIHISEANWARKNIFRLFDAFQQAKQSGIPHKLLVLGKNDKFVNNKARPIKDIHILGFVPENDLITLLQCSDVLVNPSLHEGFGLPMLEAMACKIPVITSNVFSPPAVVGEGGLFVDPRNVDDICEKIIELINDKQLRLDIAKKGFERSQKFSWNFTAKGILDLCQKYHNDKNQNFEDEYDKSAKRTLTTICLTNNKLKHKFISSIVQMDFDALIEWALEEGFDDPDVNDYLIPLTNWLEKNRKEIKLQVSSSD
jgi:glycosyltransferase involved in cell wall biosynthesis